MFKRIILYFIALLNVINGRPPWIHHGKLGVSDVHKMLQEVWPQVVDKPCKIVYRGKEIYTGEKVNHTLLQWQPEVTWPAYNDTYYTLYVAGIWLVRPKYLRWSKHYTTPYGSRAEVLEWDHWVVFNIPGCNIGKGEVLARYTPPREGLDEELYLFMVFEQPGKLDEEIVLFKDRMINPAPLICKNFTKRYNMTGPIFGNYFIKLQYPRRFEDSDDEISDVLC